MVAGRIIAILASLAIIGLVASVAVFITYAAIRLGTC